MCGIAGYIGRRSPSDSAISGALETMRRRGPDYQGHRRIHLPSGAEAVLLSSRLAIVDLDPRSNMPFTKGDWTIAFNGEIYNHEALRGSLEENGMSFSTNSDTEVLIAGLSVHGLSFLDRAEGMWAFAAVNHNTGAAILCRDRFGEKPLFFHDAPDGLYFASEPKTLQALTGKKFLINQRQLLRYLVNGYRSLYKTGETWFEGLQLFPTSSAHIISADGSSKMVRYWTPNPAPQEIEESEAVEHLQSLLPEVVKLRLRADVPVACCLSGGIDSSSIASLAVKSLGASIHTFSIIDSNPDYDERLNIELITNDLGCDAHFIEIPKAPFLERLDDLIRYHDCPLATSSYYIHSFLSEAISKNGYRVALSGTGADELFTGYYDHYLLHLATLTDEKQLHAARSAWSEKIAPHVRNPFFQTWDRFVKQPEFREHLYLRNPLVTSALRTPFSEQFTEVEYQQDLLRNRMLNEIFFEVVPPILYEDDMNSMRWSVENRSPFLDRRLFEFCFSLPSRYLINDAYQKNLLRKAMKGILVDEIRLNRRKIGFNASITTLLERNDPAVRKVLLEDNPLDEVLDLATMRQLLDQKSLTNQESQLLFSLVNATLFLHQHQ